MNTFCPFIKDKCKGNECVMWKDERCLLITFIETYLKSLERELEEYEEDYDEEFGLSESYGYEEVEEKEVPEELISATPEELAAELLYFIKREFPDEDKIWIPKISSIFWESKNVDRWHVPPEIKLKMEKAERLAEKQLEDERKIREKEQLEKEKAELPSLVNMCIDWAIARGLKRVTKSDVDAFLLENDIEILPQTKRALYSMVNVQLKSRNRY